MLHSQHSAQRRVIIHAYMIDHVTLHLVNVEAPGTWRCHIFFQRTEQGRYDWPFSRIFTRLLLHAVIKLDFPNAFFAANKASHVAQQAVTIEEVIRYFKSIHTFPLFTRVGSGLFQHFARRRNNGVLFTISRIIHWAIG